MEHVGILSEPMITLYNEVENLLIPNKFHLKSSNYINKIFTELGGNAGMKVLENGDIDIEYYQNEPFFEYVLSHELLHSFLDVRGFPRVYLNDYDYKFCDKNYKLIDEVSQLLNNLIQHKIIIKEQILRGFNIEDARKKSLRRLYLT